MSMDAFSPTAPARVRTLVLPIGRIKRKRFSTFFSLLTPACEIRLGDVSPDARPDRNMFSPLAFPDGIVLYDFSTSMPPPSHLALSPFEVFREPLVILGIADSAEFKRGAEGGSELSMDPSEVTIELSTALAAIREKYRRTLVQKILLFDSMEAPGRSLTHQDLVFLPPASKLKTNTMKTTVCDITSTLLAEMTTLAISIKALPSIVSPSGNSAANGLSNSHRYLDDSSALSRVSSGERARSASPGMSQNHRMSLPVLPSSTPSIDYPSNGTRSMSPESGRNTPPTRTLGEGNSNEKRGQGRDRVSVHGFGPGSVTERDRNKGKARVDLVVGSLYLQSGRWVDALKELSEGAKNASLYSDHLWHAKALENLMICMLLLAWSRTDFNIPQICYPIPERPSSNKGVTSKPAAVSAGNVSESQTTLRHNLASMLPDLANMIISIYLRAANVAGEHIPQLVFAESIIRCSKVLASINLAGGLLNEAAYEGVIRGLYPVKTLPSTRLTIRPTRTTITNILFRAMPGPLEHCGLSPVDHMLIIGGVASVLSSLGLQRKKAIILKEYLDALIQNLAQAKKTGAAEAGFHPSASILSLENMSSASTTNTPEGLEDFLNILCQVYGIAESRWSNSIGSDALELEAANDKGRDSSAAKRRSLLPSQLVGNFVLRFFGSVNVKSDVLRTCIRLCESLSDLRGVLHYSSALLRTAGPGIAPSSDTSDVLVTLSREEQIWVSNNILKTVATAASLGLKDVEAEYWDEFLVRGVYVVGPPESLLLHKHKRSDIGPVDTLRKVEKQSPFIHNPFLEKADNKAAINLLVAGDEREFVISLQNPYDFPVKIESIQLQSEGSEVAGAKNLSLRPYRTQSFSAIGVVTRPGKVELDRCIIKIQGCRERSFPIFSEPWAPEQDIKIKNIGLLKPQSHESARVASDTSTSSNRQSSTKPFPVPSSVSLTVVPEQPILIVSAVSLPQSALMLLEGESTRFSIVVHNTSETVAADFVHLSFRDSTTTAIQEALGNKRLSPVELFELEYQLSHYPAIRATGDVPTSIAAGSSETFWVEILGKPGLASAAIQINYASLASPASETDEFFFTRNIVIPISVTVNASVQLHRMEIIPIATNLSRDPTVLESGATGIVGLSGLRKPAQGECCLLLLDFRNAWPTPIEIDIQIGNKKLLDKRSSGSTALNSREIVQPGHIARMILLLPKLYVEFPHARIRSANERQFVVSTNVISPESERITRETFWYREEFLKMMTGAWKQEGGERFGTIDIRSVVRFNPRMVDVLKLDDLAIEVAIHGEGGESEARSVKQTGRTSFTINVDDNVTVRTTLRNRSDAWIYPLLRLQPSLAYQKTEMALDLVKRLAWSGLLQRRLPPLGPGETIQTELGICALASGEYEIGANVEEIKACDRTEKQDENGQGVASIPDLVAGTLGRRTWTASEACRITAVED
ncbi:hypercellular protein-like protein HypA [Venturia nashicola]|uniref:Hypercellular protein-like protein HypA n=1 Tax=Venturia nashicola TaxID=86259 RepID=A0A4Z1NVF4_9PEZI|nr:hypercellular protein-like protein HypA [Venturia nashicola]TLD31750.1 hypercellular protein-like protein HypA [Venturia nashicola]